MRAMTAVAALLSVMDAAAAETLDLALLELSELVDPASGESQIHLRLTPDSTRLFTIFTAARIDQKVTVSLDGVTLASPVIKTAIDSGVMLLMPGSDGFSGLSTGEVVEQLTARGVVTVSD